MRFFAALATLASGLRAPALRSVRGGHARRAAPSMAVAVFGSTGLTGRECTHQLLERGIAVRALCRTPANLLTPLGSTGKEDEVVNDKLRRPASASSRRRPSRRRPQIKADHARSA